MTTKSNATSEQTSTASTATSKAVKKPAAKTTAKNSPRKEAKPLIAKIIEAVKKTKPVTKDGRNDYSKYSYTSDQQVSAIIHSLADAGVWFIPNFEITDKWEKGKNNYVQVQGCFMLTDGNEKYDGSMPGIGADTLDKAVYKAETGAKKNFFMQFLALSTDTDIDNDQGKDMNSSGSNSQSIQHQQNFRTATNAEINIVNQLIQTYADSKGGNANQIYAWALREIHANSFKEASKDSIKQLTIKLTKAVNDANGGKQ